jgi:hypothetical protein
MTAHPVEPSEPIDRKTSRSICDAVGERLQRDLRPEALSESSRLELLMDAIRRQDRGSDLANVPRGDADDLRTK